MTLNDLVLQLAAFVPKYGDRLVIDQDGNDITDVYVGEWAHDVPEVVLTSHIDHELRRNA